MSDAGKETIVRVHVTGPDGVPRKVAVTLGHFEPPKSSYWVASARVVIGGEELLYSTAGQVTPQAALRVVARWLYARCAAAGAA